MSYKRETREPSKGLEEKGFGWSADGPRFYWVTLINNQENSLAPNSKIWTCGFRVIRSNPMSTKMRT